jgi:peptidylprolyl isomerase
MTRAVPLVFAGLVLVGCGSPVEPADEALGGPWTVFDCSIVGPGVDVDGPLSGPGTSDVVVIGDADQAPEVGVAGSATGVDALDIVDITVGSGDAVQPGDVLTVEYCGVGLTTRTVFDSSWSRGQPAQFPLDRLIPGWQEGLPGMQVGGQRLLVIPGALAYGDDQRDGIAPNETLIFVIDLIERLDS